MGYTNLFATQVSGAVATQLANRLKSTFAFASLVNKVVVPKGQSSVSLIKPGSISSTTRASGAAIAAGTKPTDTTVSITPSTEYIATIPLDRLDTTRSAITIIDLYAPMVANKIAEDVNTAGWALITTDVTTNTVGNSSTPAPMSLLAQAWAKLFAAKATTGEFKCCIGGPEAQMWLPDQVFNNYGPAGQEALVKGTIGQRFGFDIFADQQRYFSGSTSYSIAFHPLAFCLGFRQETTARQGTAFGMATHAETGLTVFTEITAMSEVTNGAGNNISSWIIADFKTIYESWACLLLSSATA